MLTHRKPNPRFSGSLLGSGYVPIAQKRREVSKRHSDSAFYLGVAVSSAWHKEFLFESKGNIWWTNSRIISVPQCQQRNRKGILPGYDLLVTADMYNKMDQTLCDLRKLISLGAMDLLTTFWKDWFLLVTTVNWRISFLNRMLEVRQWTFSFL